jgi:hypothetical protein
VTAAGRDAAPAASEAQALAQRSERPAQQVIGQGRAVAEQLGGPPQTDARRRVEEGRVEAIGQLPGGCALGFVRRTFEARGMTVERIAVGNSATSAPGCRAMASPTGSSMRSSAWAGSAICISRSPVCTGLPVQRWASANTAMPSRSARISLRASSWRA